MKTTSFAELEAKNLLYGVSSSTNSDDEMELTYFAGDYILALAERIKTGRLAAAINLQRENENEIRKNRN